MPELINCICWERQREDGGFSPYPPDISNVIEAVYLSGMKEFVMPSAWGSSRIIIDFDRMLHLDLQPATVALRFWYIKRNVVGVVVPFSPSITAYWMWNDHGMNFVPYNIQSSVDIELAFASGYTGVDLSKCTSRLPYTIDFQTGKQMSHFYGTRRQIYRCILPVKTTLQSLLHPVPPMCPYFLLCERFLGMLNIPAEFRDKVYDRCFCICCATQWNEEIGCEGDPPMHFTIPKGYAKFALRVTHHAEYEEIFKKWHVCYHGTNPEHISDIIRLGRLIKPGDILPSGTQIKEKVGHFNENFCPSGFNSKQYFFSPVVEYSCNDAFASKYKLFHENHGPITATTILQVKLKPGTYKVGPSTIREEVTNGLYFEGNIEWMTDREGVHCIYGVLVKLMQPRVTASLGPFTHGVHGFSFGL